MAHASAAGRRGRSLLRARLVPSILLPTLAAAGCMSRDVARVEPTTSAVLTENRGQTAIDKIDLLFMIDDSASMGDKQAYLKKAIPDLIDRLVTPNCVDPNDPTHVFGRSAEDGTCMQGELEFHPVKSIHIAIVTSSMGGLGSGSCPGPEGDKGAHLVTRTGSKNAPSELAPAGFLAWAPSGDGGAIAQRTAFEDAFEDVVAGVGETGCGLEQQLESWYRFLVQPDPYASIAIQNGVATLSGVDTTILQQRHDFLRPDSLVAVVVVSDENDSGVDPRSLGGRGWSYFQDSGHFAPLRGTTACATDPSDPACVPCDTTHPQDPRCALGPYTTALPQPPQTLEDRDNLNLRHVHMKQKYGLDAQYPIDRYVAGLSSPKVPDRDHEHTGGAPEYTGGTDANCTNPLFAASLPDGTVTDPKALCDLPAGRRRADLVYYAHIGGVPQKLLHFDPNDPKASLLTDDDWTKILGKDPEHFHYDGIDSRMIESTLPRQGLPGPSAADDADDQMGRDYDSSQDESGSDLMFACTFAITPRSCAGLPGYQCDCITGTSDGRKHAQLPPLCDASDPTKQIRAKAYPTTRELLVAKKLGQQGIVSSLCPLPISDTNDPRYGYRPAATAIIDRLKAQLDATCVPHPLQVDDNAQVPCRLVVTLPDPGDESACAKVPGLTAPATSELPQIRDAQRANAQPGDPDTSTLPVCVATQLGKSDTGGASCATSATPGWCYVSGPAAGACDQAIRFSKTGNPPAGAKVQMMCIESL